MRFYELMNTTKKINSFTISKEIDIKTLFIKKFKINIKSDSFQIKISGKNKNLHLAFISYIMSFKTLFTNF